MKLIDILVEELPKRGGWPEGYDFVCSEGPCGAVWAYKTKHCTAGKELYFHSPVGGSVTREQYESALVASKQAWNGEGLPPVGCDCELSTAVEFYTHSGSTDFEEGTVVVVGGTVNFGLGEFVAIKVKGTNCITDINPCFLRPIRSEADKKREEAVIALSRVDPKVVPFEYGDKCSDGSLIGSAWYDLYDAIAAGKIPHIRIE